MGAWDKNPWDNDGAANWFGDLLGASGLPSRIEETLKRDARTHHEAIRAATSMLIFIGRKHIWPAQLLDAHLRLAISKMEEIAALNIYKDEFATEIEHEIDVLKTRLEKAEPSEAEVAWQWWLSWR